MRILGERHDDGKSNACIRGRKGIRDHGAVTFIPYWEKTWLSLWPFEAQVHIQMSVTISPRNNMEKKNQPQYLLLMATTN